MKVIIPNENETYNEYINRILESRENKKDKDNYQERHHIQPKCLGGKDEQDNLIYLYAQEHYYAHKLLAIENPEISGLQYAWLNMCQCTQKGQRTYEISAEDYAEARSICAKLSSDRMMGENNPMYGKNLSGENSPMYGTHLSEETKQKISTALKGTKTGLNNPNYGKSPSQELRDAQSKRMSGENNPMYGKRGELSPNFGRKHTEEELEKMSKALKGKGIGRKISEETRTKLSEAHKGDKAAKATAVKCIETGEIFSTIQDACSWCKVNRNEIRRYFNGKIQTAGKHPITGEKLHWVIVE